MNNAAHEVTAIAAGQLFSKRLTALSAAISGASRATVANIQQAFVDFVAVGHENPNGAKLRLSQRLFAARQIAASKQAIWKATHQKALESAIVGAFAHAGIKASFCKLSEKDKEGSGLLAFDVSLLTPATAQTIADKMRELLAPVEKAKAELSAEEAKAKRLASVKKAVDTAIAEGISKAELLALLA